MLALHGFDAYGLDVSATGVSVAREYAKSELEHPHAYNFGDSSPFSPEKIQIQGGRGRGQVTIIQGDFFKSDWEFKEKQNGVKFDLIYDYTFLCALHPKMRQQWAFRMADLLTPTGLLVCLEFPLWKDLKLPGPPWGLNGVHWNLLAEGGDGIFYDDGYGFRGGEGEGKGAFTRKLYVKPVRSYEQGRGTDMLSVYVKK
ncbi:hypothetical protein MPDQ_005679 [Monascus purpureus]|uniref:S-adenosyl-L-methionine-dependent methyltransferase n=1 Tax=Monascus purpureus TaxID=5098 RepID=A0A507QW30_MONPU|nr:hypothetical protein MPDQ_005679 [Monascus purpureus]